MSISSALSIATSGLGAANARAQVTAENVANAQTAGYVRRSAILAEAQIGGRGDGVRVLGIERAVASGLVAERMRTASAGADAAQRDGDIAAVTSAFGAPGDQTGLFAAYGRFETALRDAAATPESGTLLEGLATSARDLAIRIGLADARANSIRTGADRDIGIAVGEVNDALERLGTLNRLAPSQVTPAVLDERQRLTDQINAVIPVEAIERGDKLHLLTEGGVFLLTNSAHPIEFSPAGLVGRGETLGTSLSGISVDGIDLTPSGEGVQRSRGGRIAGLFATRDETVPGFQDSLDILAGDLLSRFSDDAIDPTKVPGEAGLFTDGLSASTVGSGIGLAARLQLNVAVDRNVGGDVTLLRDGLGASVAGPSGNGDQLNRLLDGFTAGQGAIRGAADLSAELGQKTRNAADRAVISNVRLQAAQDAEQRATGVDTDTELQNLLAIEQAYAANARVIQTVSDMLDELMRAIR